MAFVKERLGKWISAVITIVIGILCIVVGAQSGNADPDAADAISLIIGITLIVVGSLSLVLALVGTYYTKGKGFLSFALPGGVALALGISFVVGKYALNLIGLLIYVIPYFMIVIGAIILIDACFRYFVATKGKVAKEGLVSMIVTFVVAVGLIVVGALCVGNKPVIGQDVQLIVFGVAVTLMGALQLLASFARTEKK